MILFDNTSNPQYSGIIHKSRYSRYLPKEQRRESWEETTQRLADFWGKRFPGYKELWDSEIIPSIRALDVMPSMRTLMTAGRALERDEIASFNCSYVACDHPRVFDEVLYLLACGVGVGFSVERQLISKLPTVSEEFHESDSIITVGDSKIGWASAFRELISLLYAGKVPKWDMSSVRAAGEPLEVFGGRASGPAPLDELFNYTTAMFKDAAGRRLTSIECHGILCKIGETIVVGGVRRSACISLSNLSDDRMRLAKMGQWWEHHPEYSLANNSAVYTEKPAVEIFMKEWLSLIESKSGERGISNRYAIKKHIESLGRRDPDHEFGVNPCGEIYLRPNSTCNLSEVVVRAGDTFDELARKVRLASIIGTFQSTLTNFRYLRKKWKDNIEEERLLGVSLTGIMDHPFLNGSTVDDAYNFCGNKDATLEQVLEELKQVAIDTNRKWAEKLGISQSVAVTTVKPSGTVSQLVDSASGIHPRYSPYYIRTIRADKKDPLSKFMIESGFPVEDDVMKPDATYVFSFPIKAPEDAIFRDDRSAIEQLELWLTYKRHWTEHNPSITIYVRDDEWMEVGAWVFKHFDEVSGVSFLPHTNHSYRQAPYQEVSEEVYNEWLAKMPQDVDWEALVERQDDTKGSGELACTGGTCELSSM